MAFIKEVKHHYTCGMNQNRTSIRWQMKCDMCSKKFIGRPKLKKRYENHYCTTECFKKLGTTPTTVCKTKGCISTLTLRSRNLFGLCKNCHGNKTTLLRVDYERALVYNLLGNKCKCCGETDPIYLQIDHVNNDGFREKGTHRRCTLKKYMAAPHKYQLLCANCNIAKVINKGKLYKPNKKRGTMQKYTVYELLSKQPFFKKLDVVKAMTSESARRKAIIGTNAEYTKTCTMQEKVNSLLRGPIRWKTGKE